MINLYEKQKELFEKYMKFKKKQKRILALLSMERQFVVYKECANNQEWDRTIEYRNLLDCVWRILLEKNDFTEELWEKHELIRPENVCTNISLQNEDFSYANIFATNFCSFIDMVLDDLEGEDGFALLNYDFLNTYEEDKKIELPRMLYEREKNYQDEDMLQVYTFCSMEDIHKRICVYENMMK